MSFPYLNSAEHSDIGRVRSRNEDAVLCMESIGVFCIADGMGGMAGGDIASRAVRETLADELVKAYQASSNLPAVKRVSVIDGAVGIAGVRVTEEVEVTGAAALAGDAAAGLADLAFAALGVREATGLGRAAALAAQQRREGDEDDTGASVGMSRADHETLLCVARAALGRFTQDDTAGKAVPSSPSPTES